MSASRLLHPLQFKAQQAAAETDRQHANVAKGYAYPDASGKPYRGVPFSNFDYKGIGPTAWGSHDGDYPANHGRSQKESDETDAWRKREKAKQGQPRRYGGSTGSSAIVNPFMPGGYLG